MFSQRYNCFLEIINDKYLDMCVYILVFCHFIYTKVKKVKKTVFLNNFAAKFTVLKQIFYVNEKVFPFSI